MSRISSNSKKFFIFSLIAASLIFAIFSGGCGGSSGTIIQPEPPDNNDMQKDSHLEKFFTSNDHIAIIDEIISEQNLSTRLKTQDVSDKIILFTSESKLTDASINLSEALDNGYTIALIYADEAKINECLRLLGVDDKYTAPEDQKNPNVEIFAISQREINGLKRTFIYTTPHLSNITTASSDNEEPANHQCTEITSEDGQITNSVSGDKADNLPHEFIMEDFNRDRVKDFLQWVINLDMVQNDIHTSSDTEDLKNLTAGKNYQFSFPYTSGGESKWDYYPNRQNLLNYTVYAVHSFAEGTDYYLIKLNSTTNPSDQFADVTNREICPDQYLSNHLSGYTRMLYWSNSVRDVVNADDVTIIENSPETLNSSRTHSNGFSYNFSGSISFNGSNATGSFSAGVSYSTTDTTTIFDYEVSNNCLSDNLSTARWYYTFAWPNTGADHISLTEDYQGVNATTASKTTHTAHLDWILAVKPVYWETHNKLTINGMYSFMDGKTNGKHYWILWYHHSRVDYSYNWVNNEYKLTLDKPPHIAINNSANVNLTKKAGQGTFNLLSDKSWTIKADQNWIKSFNYTSGEGTGDSPVEILYDVAENTTGKIRNANIIITASDGENCTVKISQSGN